MDGEQDICKMGGLRRYIPVTYALISGQLGPWRGFRFCGYYSKDIILEAAFAHHSTFGLAAYWVGIWGSYDGLL